MPIALRRSFEPAVAVLFGLVVIRAASLWFSLDPGPRAPTEAEWAAVSRHIDHELAPGDVLRIHPFWLREGTVVAEAVGPERLTLDLSVPLDPMTLYGNKRLWLVSAFGRTDAGPPPGATLDQETSFPGGLLLRRYALAESPIALAFTDELRSATVERWPAGGAHRTCRWAGSKHECRGRPWEDVRVERKEIGGAPRTCFVLHPYPSGGTVALRFPKVALGAGILVRAGFTLEAAKTEHGSDAKLTVRVGQRVALERVERQNAWDFVPSYIDTGDLRGKTADIVLEVTAANEEFRDLCIDGFVVSRPVPEAEAARRCQNPSENPGPGGC